MKRRMLVLALIILLLLTACGNGPEPDETEPAVRYDWMAGECPIPTERTGNDRQGVSGISNAFECTDTGCYFMFECVTSLTRYILYVDHGSDTIIKLCGRPDCTHDSMACNAAVYNGCNICYYDGYLYFNSGSPIATQLNRIDLDGTGRTTVLDLGRIQLDSEYKISGMGYLKIWNGLFTFSRLKLDENGDSVLADSFYYKLDGSMERPERSNCGYTCYNDGEDFITLTMNEPIMGEMNVWDPETDTVTYLTDNMGLGYYGTEQAYYFKDGNVVRLTYATGEEEVLIQTELEGNYRVFCFPDGLMLACNEADPTVDPTLYIYNWAFEYVDRVELDILRGENPAYSIVGETPERIILSGDDWYIPRYYIEKSDFGTGNIEIHEYKLPDLEEELAALDKALTENGY